jgi:hypothetical protein
MLLENAEVTVIYRFKYPLNTGWFGFFRVWRSVLCCRLVGSKETRVVGGWQETNKQRKKKGSLVGAEAKEREWKEKKKLVISVCSLCECFCKLYQTGSGWGRGSRHRLRLPWGCFQS